MPRTIKGELPRSDWHNIQHLNAWRASMRRSLDNFQVAIYKGTLFYRYDAPDDWTQDDIDQNEVHVRDTSAKTKKCTRCEKTRSIIYYDPYWDEKALYHLRDVCTSCMGRQKRNRDTSPVRGYFDVAPSDERLKELQRRYREISKMHGGLPDGRRWKESLFSGHIFGPLPD